MITYDIEHFYGSQEIYDLQLVKLNLNTNNLNEKEALENGWLLSKNKWYACRSVRINIDKFKITKNKLEYIITDEPLAEIADIYKQFILYKGFTEEYDLFADKERSKWLVLIDDGMPVAFTKFINYAGGIESQFTAWNYHKPKMSIGKKIVNYEIEYAKTYGYSYLYIGQGYESGSAYKSDFAGFEWWTGQEWSTDKEKYKELCHRDSTINNISDIAKVYNE